VRVRVFFLTDLSDPVQDLWRMVCPGGVRAVSGGVRGPCSRAPRRSGTRSGPRNSDLVEDFQPWTRVTDAADLTVSAAGLAVEREQDTHPLNDPRDRWKVVMGTGFAPLSIRLSRRRLRGCSNPASSAYVAMASNGLDANVTDGRLAKPVD
jgi:hypothetical protein